MLLRMPVSRPRCAAESERWGNVDGRWGAPGLAPVSNAFPRSGDGNRLPNELCGERRWQLGRCTRLLYRLYSSSFERS